MIFIKPLANKVNNPWQAAYFINWLPPLRMAALPCNQVL
jgi:hypothetical protein